MGTGSSSKTAMFPILDSGRKNVCSLPSKIVYDFFWILYFFKIYCEVAGAIQSWGTVGRGVNRASGFLMPLGMECSGSDAGWGGERDSEVRVSQRVARGKSWDPRRPLQRGNTCGDDIGTEI